MKCKQQKNTELLLLKRKEQENTKTHNNNNKNVWKVYKKTLSTNIINKYANKYVYIIHVYYKWAHTHFFAYQRNIHK